MSGSGGDFKLAASLDDYEFELDLSAIKAPVIYDEDGFVEYGEDGGSYYYSYTRIGTTGTLTDQGTRVEVAGLSWMDHQWGDFLVSDIGWDWFSLQLDDGTDIMYYDIRDRQRDRLTSFGTVADAEGKPTPLGSGDVTVRALGSWTSSLTGAEYPMGWAMNIPSLELSLNLSPVLSNAEFHVAGSALPTYWEGEVVVTGSRSGDPVGGQGFVELVGYAGP